MKRKRRDTRRPLYGLRWLTECTQERLTHSLPVTKACLSRDDLYRVTSCLHHQASRFHAQTLESVLAHVPGVDVIGLLPQEIQLTTVFAAAVCKASSDPGATRALLSFLASTDADAAKRRHGMEPA